MFLLQFFTQSCQTGFQVNSAHVNLSVASVLWVSRQQPNTSAGIDVSPARHAGKTCWAQTAWILECIHTCFMLLKLSGMSCLAYVRKNSSILQTHTHPSMEIVYLNHTLKKNWFYIVNLDFIKCCKMLMLIQIKEYKNKYKWKVKI